MSDNLKSYWVQEKDAEWEMFIHASSPSKAKSAYLEAYPEPGEPEFINIRATRPEKGADLLDIVPFTDTSLELAGYMPDGFFPDVFLEFCGCEMCNAEKRK